MFYMDIQTFFERDLKRHLREAEGEVTLIRAVPEEIRTGADGRPEAIHQGPDEAKVVTSFDLVVLSVGIFPVHQLPMQGVTENDDGFLGTNDREVATAWEGVFVAGTAQGPRSIEETVSHAIRSAAETALCVRDME